MSKKAFSPAELWIVQPPDPPAEFHQAVGHLLYAGIDFAFGEQDTLPSEPPRSLDGIKMILVYLEDLPRIKNNLTGFHGFDPYKDPPYDLSRGTYLYVNMGKRAENQRLWFVQTAIHKNRTTWLAIYGKNALGFYNRLENPLMLTGDLTLNSDSMKKRLLARPDKMFRDQWIENVLKLDRTDWGDIPYNIGKSLLDDYEITGDQRCLDRTKDLYSRMLDDLPLDWRWLHIAPGSQLARLYQITGDEKIREVICSMVEGGLDDPVFKKGASGFCHATQAFNGPTFELLKNESGDMGSFGELMSLTYFAMMAMAKPAGREAEIADLIAQCVKEQRKNLRDEKTGLYHHGIPCKNEKLEGFLGHGTGWSAFGLSQILDIFPKNHPEYNDLVEILREICEAAAKVQDNEGAFHSILNFHWTPVCVHYVCWFGYVFLHGVRMGHLDESYRDRGLKAWHALKARAFNGGVIAAAAGTPVSRRMQYYLERFSILRRESFVNGATAQPLYLLNEVIQSNNKP